MVDFEENKLTLARAGHNLPLHFSSVKGTTNWLNPPGLGIGMKKNPGFGDILEQTTVSLGDDDLLLFYTDGITEAMNRQDHEFGTERMERILVENAHRDVDEMAQRIKSHILTQLDAMQQLPLEDLLAKRYQRLMSYGN